MSGGGTPMPTTQFIVDDKRRLTFWWQTYLESLNFYARPLGTSGTTEQRPNPTSLIPLYVGQSYFDTTLGKPVWVKSLNPTVWVDGVGTVS